jgi:protein-tyrosine-phosphatase
MSIPFLCTGNACRSQMAGGRARRLTDNAIGIQSVGIDRSTSIRMTGTRRTLKHPKIFSGLLMTNILAIKKHKYSA